MNIKQYLEKQRQQQWMETPEGKEEIRKRRDQLKIWAAFQQFVAKHDAGVPAWLASKYLGMTPQGIFEASERGWITYFQYGRNRLYSKKDLEVYRYGPCRKFNDYSPVRPNQPGESEFRAS